MDDSTTPLVIASSIAALWLALTTLFGVLSGWYKLMRRYPDSGETALETVNYAWGALGLINYKSCLSLSACASGLRVRIPRAFGPFCRPFLVPWSEISIKGGNVFGFKTARLEFGGAGEKVGALLISESVARRLTQTSGPAGRGAEPPKN